MAKNLNLLWTKSFKSQKEKEDFEVLLRNSTQLLNRLRGIVEELQTNITSEEVKPESYDAGYPFKQAFLNGQKKILKTLETLLKL